MKNIFFDRRGEPFGGIRNDLCITAPRAQRPVAGRSERRFRREHENARRTRPCRRQHGGLHADDRKRVTGAQKGGGVCRNRIARDDRRFERIFCELSERPAREQTDLFLASVPVRRMQIIAEI